MFAIVHEYTHAVVDHIKFRYSYDNKYPLVELPSMTSELIAGDIINCYYTNLGEEVRNYLLASVSSLNQFAKELLKADEFLSTHTLDNDEQLKYNINYFSKKSKELKMSLSNRLQLENICYLIPFIYSVELYNLYNKDKELFLYDMDKIITMENSDNYYEELKRLGLVPNQNMRKHVERIKRG